MKASLKFREDQKPLVRAKIPLSIIGLPFLSGISAGDSKELCLNLSTFFESGPSLKISYRPNDSWSPFSLVVKTGIGSFGSPISAPLAMSAEFNLLGHGNPSFFLQFKPQIGDFCVKKTAGSAISLPSEPVFFGGKIKLHAEDPDTDGEGSVDRGETPKENGGFRQVNGAYSGEKVNGFPLRVQPAGGFDSLFSGVEVRARSVFPLRNRALLKFQWGLRFPPELRSSLFDEGTKDPTAGISLRKIPLLVMNKISIEHVSEHEKDTRKSGTRGVLPSTADVAEACFSVRHQLDALHAENGFLRRAVEDLRSEIGAGKIASGTGTKDLGKCEKGGKSTVGKSDWRGGNKTPEFGGYSGKVTDDDVSEELKKSLLAATGAGI
eukprot:TRINITY_DN20378_c0_g1_i1.p1 TRINITY_DN20378_c0_g1~~TRINITY_DN20378_c0_g1_i1.p1  ORF type:complete len:379 (-),score=28.50 TRINITY_DN20378_c0_g1_i1:262-1398(-)